MSRTTTTRTATRTLAALLPAAALALVPLTSASAARGGPELIPLVTGSSPEGISAGPGTSFFAGARADGAVYRGDVRTGELTELVAGQTGEIAVGLLYDATTERLWVAGGTTGDVTAYDPDTGEVLFTANAGMGRFLNDVAVTRDAVYVTDSRTNQIVVIPLTGGDLPADGTFEVLDVRGDYVQPTGFGLNGIRVLPDGDLLVVSGGVLYAVDPQDGDADRIEQSGRQLVGGDGLVLDGRTLYAVNGYGGDEVAVLRFAPDFQSVQATGLIRDVDLDRPTTGALIDGALYVVNGRFETLADDPDAPVQVVKLRAR